MGLPEGIPHGTADKRDSFPLPKRPLFLTCLRVFLTFVSEVRAALCAGSRSLGSSPGPALPGGEHRCRS